MAPGAVLVLLILLFNVAVLTLFVRHFGDTEELLPNEGFVFITKQPFASLCSFFCLLSGKLPL